MSSKAPIWIKSFATAHRLRTITDKGDGTTIIAGRKGHIYEYGNRLAVMFLPSGWAPKKWGNARRACEAAGMSVLQDGDSEGSIAFDPSDPNQAKLAKAVAGCKTIRRVSEAQKEQLRTARALSHVGRPLLGSSDHVEESPLVI